MSGTGDEELSPQNSEEILLDDPLIPKRMELEGARVHEEHIFCALRDVCQSRPSHGLCAPCLFGFNSRIVGCYYIRQGDYLDDED